MHGLFGRLGGLVGTVSVDARGTRVLAVEDSRHVFGTVVGIHFELPLGALFLFRCSVFRWEGLRLVQGSDFLP